MTSIKSCLIAGLGLLAAATLPPAPASAATLPDGAVIAGVWKVKANTSTLLLQIESQGGDGSGCTRIAGYMYPVTGANQSNTDPVRGYFCLSTGQITFLRDGATSQGDGAGVRRHPGREQHPDGLVRLVRGRRQLGRVRGVRPVLAQVIRLCHSGRAQRDRIDAELAAERRQLGPDAGADRDTCGLALAAPELLALAG